MDYKEAIKILSEHNQWRQGNDDVEMIPPKILTEAIQTIVQELDWKYMYFRLLKKYKIHMKKYIELINNIKK